jgi:hypothetical protein
MKIGDIASAVGKGLVAGAVGTVAITATTVLANKLKSAEPSTVPAEAGEKVLGVEPKGQQEEQRLNTVMHVGYGLAWGVPRGLMSAFGLRGLWATVTHFFAVWGTALGMLPGLKLAPPPTRWDRKELAIDAFHHLVYAGATTAAFNFLDRRSERAHLEAA